MNPARHNARFSLFFRAIVASAWLLIALAGSNHAWGHGSSGPLKDQRVILLQIHPDRVELGYSVILGPTTSENTRIEADADHNGAIDDTEKASIGETWRASAKKSLRVTIDGSPATFELDAAKVSLDGTAVNGALITVALHTKIDAGSTGAHVIEINDDIALPRGGDLDVQAWARGSARITEGGSSEGKSWSQHRHAGAADLRGPVSMHFVGGGKDPTWARYVWIGGGIAGLVVFVVGLRTLRTRRR